MQHSDGIEIERKFLLHELPPRVEKKNSVLMEQGYISPEIADVEVRIRSAGEGCYLTLKKGRGMLRREEEISIARDNFISFWPFTEDARIRKTRYRVTENDVSVEIDEYHDGLAPLVVAEVELPPGADFLGIDLPGWLGAEITGLPEFTNQHLARHGLPDELLKVTLSTADDTTRPITHAGAIPYRYENGTLQILLITSRVKKNWIAPKGIWDAGCDLDEIAATEAWEEAGVTGALDKKAIGIYEESKNGGADRIELFALKVEKQEKKWPEMDIRKRRWFDFDQALSTVTYPGIAVLMQKLHHRLLA